MQLYSTAPEARAKFIDEACNKDCGKVVGMDVDKAMLAAMQAAVNDDIPLIWDDNLVDDNVVKHATNAQNLDDHFLWTPFPDGVIFNTEFDKRTRNK